MRSPRSWNPILVTTIGSVGLALLWWLTPTRPHTVWQPPSSEAVVGLLSDNRSIVTTGWAADGMSNAGPFVIRDLQTGQGCSE